MKIAMLTKHFNFRNGSSHAIHEISTRLVAWGHEVHIFCNKRPVSYSDALVLRPVAMLQLGSWAKALSFHAGCARWMRRERFDIVHGHGNTIGQDVVTICICRRANLIARGLPLSRWDPHLWIERKQFQDPKLSRIITLSEMVRKDLHRYYGIPLDRMVTIPNGVNSEQFHPGLRVKYREEMRNRHGIEEDECLVLFVASGNFENRGLRNLYAALKQVRDRRMRVIIIGGDRLALFRRLAREQDLLSRLLFVPFTATIERYYGMGDMLVFPTYYDTFGQVVLEAMACGLPVIVSAQAGASEIITDGKDGLILKDPADAGTLAQFLRTLEDAERQRRLGLAARATALRYTWDAVAERTLAEYERIIKARG